MKMSIVHRSEKHVDLLEDFLADKRLLSKLSLREYEGKIRRFFRKYNEITASNLVDFLDSMRTKDRTKRHYLTILRMYSEFLFEHGILSLAELKKIKRIRIRIDSGRKPSQKWALSQHQVREALTVLANPRLWMTFWVGVNYGLRSQEHRNLKLPDVHLNEQILEVRESKGNKTRRIPILSGHVKVWEEWFAYRRRMGIQHEYVFFTKTGKYGKRTLERDFSEITSILKFRNIIPQDKKITSHTLRYTYATRLYVRTRNLELVRQMLGHSSVVTTQKYLSFSEKEYFDQYREALE